MCRPDFFGIEYEINAWMHLENAVNPLLAHKQWSALYTVYQELGETIDLVEPVAGLPDMVYSANAGLIWNGQVVLSNFRHSQRQREQPLWNAAFAGRHWNIATLPSNIAFEGAGDGLFVGDMLFCGYGFRSDANAHDAVGRLLEVQTVPLELVDPRFYHLDTCFSPLDDHSAMFFPGAFSPASADLIRELVDNAIEVPQDVATGFACNALTLGKTIVSSTATEKLRGVLMACGYELTTLPMTEFMKGGGGVRCLSLPLNVGVVPPS